MAVKEINLFDHIFMPSRIFIAINLPENIKNKLAGYKEKRPDLPVRWTKKENLHITLMFLGYLSDEELLEVCKITEEIASKNSSFLINFKKICYGPPRKMPSGPDERRGGWQEDWSPRMIWVEGEKSEKLGKLQKNLENSFLTPSVKGLESQSRPYTPHLTLGRIKTWEFRKIEPEEKPEIDEDINLSFEVNSIEIMESQLKRGGPKYTILETCLLGSRN